MNILGKILVLLMVIFGILSAIVVFYETQVSIPETPQQYNSHLSYLRCNSLSIVGITNSENLTDLDSTKFLHHEKLENVYKRQLLALKRFREEKFISDTEYNNQLDTLVLCYSYAFVFQAHSLFKEREWPVKDRTFLIKRVSELNALVSLGNDCVLSRHPQEKLLVDAVSTSCNDYVKATNLLSHTSYIKMSTSISQIQVANELLDKGSLSLNQNLTNELINFPTKIGDDHLHLIKDIVDRIANWRNNTLIATLSSYQKLVSETDYYKSNGYVYKGNHPYNVDPLLNAALINKNEAIDNLSTLTVNGNSSDFIYTINGESSVSRFEVNTDHPEGFSIHDTSSEWFRVENHGSNIVSVICEENKGSERTDYFTVRAGKKSIKISIKQEPKSEVHTESSFAPKSDDVWTKELKSNCSVKISVISNNNCDLDLFVYRPDGSLISKDDSSASNASVSFYTVYSGVYRIKIHNCENRYCSYSLVIDQ